MTFLAPDAPADAPADAKAEAALATWLDGQAQALDSGAAEPALLLPRLGAAGVFGAGVPQALGGRATRPGQAALAEAVEAIARLSARSLAAGFVAWSQRSFIEYLLQSPNAALRERLLPGLLSGAVAGATGLSNAMKFLSGLEALQITARPEGAGWRLDGLMPWVTNLRREGFHVAAAIGHGDGRGAFVAALPHDTPGLHRSADLELMAMRATNTAAITLDAAPVGAEHVLHEDAARWLPQVRPAFLGLQCGLSIGLARRALEVAQAQSGPARAVLRAPLAALEARLAAEVQALYEGLEAGRFQAQAAPLFRIRIALAEIAAEAVGLELQASGGRAYLQPQGVEFARRWREAAFLPVITPSLVQLKAALAAAARPERAA
ncbi:acyl-CoA dehydrogenase family protein [Roseomonas sp. GC11]|uniref:acyl-CoA dehydrogenase family protein n=1 Tax=Roseomonas sp. GC11 TaxID=2950546 RepID=UPI00272E6AC5|nr:acyl-CoA dehydrogenase family protein [Roseomonas sp. GC11]